MVEEHVAAYVACVLEIGALRQLCREFGLPGVAQNPYNYAIKAVLRATYMELSRVGFRENIQFVFDERGEKRHLESAWEFFIQGTPERARQLIYGLPRFENSIDCSPLQAAEIVAWRAREHWLKYRSFQGGAEQFWHQNSPIKGLLVHWDYDALKPNMRSLRELLLNLDHLVS